jgi:hypothetical protein
MPLELQPECMVLRLSVSVCVRLGVCWGGFAYALACGCGLAYALAGLAYAVGGLAYAVVYSVELDSVRSAAACVAAN